MNRCGSYRYFQYHEGGKRKKLYLGKISDSESDLAAKRAKPVKQIDGSTGLALEEENRLDMPNSQARAIVLGAHA